MTGANRRAMRREPLASRIHAGVGFYGLFGCLGAFTLATGDSAPLAPLIISALFMLAMAVYFSLPFDQTIALNLPVICLLAMSLYAVAQTLFFPQKIVFDGWNGVLYWFTAAGITAVASQVFADARIAVRFRDLFIWFGTAVCLLDLLEQATNTNRYFWLIPSRYSTVFGPFAYWNNFAQFAELLLPVTLWKGLAARRPQFAYLGCAALQVSAVVASGSRAGTVLVAAGMTAVIALAALRHRNRLFVASAALTLVISSGLVYAAGFNTVIAKLQQNDQLAVRRNINRSSLAMIRERPLTGWGMKAYVEVYRMFALYDDGTYVNQAHNDWLEWAAEGGIPFAAVMLAVVGWSLGPAVRAGWAVGLIALLLHALVDYPFARFGVCGWYYGLLGMLAAASTKPALPSSPR